MKSKHQILCGLPFVIVAYSLLPTLAHAQFTQQGPKLVGTEALGNALQGRSVSLSGDGSTAIVGGPSDDGGVGAAWVFTRSGGVWRQQAKLVGTVIAAGAAGEGSSVSLSGDGNTAIVGRPGDGAAWVYTRVGGAWSLQAKLIPAASFEGLSISLSGDGNTAIVGRPGDGFVGAAYVFTRTNGAWSQQAKLVGTGAVGPLPSFQGFSVSLSADGNTALVGGSTDNNEAGAAWVFARSGGMWNQQAKLVGTGAVSPSEQGYSVSLSADGKTAIVGGPLDNSSAGAAWVFTRSGGRWSEQAKLIGKGAVNVAEQGASVSLSGDGNTAIIGGPDDNGGAGAAWLYTRARGVWSQQAKLVGTGAVGSLGATQGWSVSLSSDQSTAIVGGPEDNSSAGAAWVFAQPVFAGKPGMANCHGKSVSALAQQYGGLNNAAADLGYSSVSALQNAIIAFCRE
jgi:lipocalin